MLNKQDCKYGDNCTFAYHQEEIDVWTEERKGTLNRDLLFDPLGGIKRGNLTITKILKEHQGIFTFLCEVWNRQCRHTRLYFHDIVHCAFTNCLLDCIIRKLPNTSFGHLGFEGNHHKLTHCHISIELWIENIYVRMSDIISSIKVYGQPRKTIRVEDFFCLHMEQACICFSSDWAENH